MAGKRHGWDGEQDRLNPFRFLLLLIGIGGVIAVIWWANEAGYIKHVDDVPPPVTARGSAPPPVPSEAPSVAD